MMRTKKALYNIISQTMLEIVTMVCGLILPRLILSAFGSEYNGMVQSITQFLDYISFLTLGVSGSTRVAIYKANSRNDLNVVSAILKATENYMHKVAYAFIAYMFLLAFIFPYISKTENYISVFLLVIIIGLGTFAEYFFGITYRTFLMANQCIYISNIVQIGLKVANTLVSVVLILCGGSIHVVKFGSAICYVVSPLILNWIVVKKFHIIKDILPDSSALDQRKDALAHSIANCIHEYTDIFLLTIFLSPKIVSVYSIYNIVLAALRKVQNIFTTGLEAAFGDLWAKKEYKKFANKFDTLEYLVYCLVIIMFTTCHAMILPFMKIYTRGITDVNYILPIYATIAVIATAMYCVRVPYIIAVQAAGKYKETKKGAFWEAGLNLGISLIGVIRWGLIGVTVGTLVANLFRTAQYMLFLSKYMLQRGYRWIFKRVSWTIGTAAIVMLIFSLDITNIDSSNWISWAFSSIIHALIAIIITFLTSLIMYRKSLVDSVGLMKAMLKRKQK